MKIKRAIKYFVVDYGSLLLVVFITQVFFFGLLFYFKRLWMDELIYFGFLSFVILLIYLLAQFYKRGRIYEKFLQDSGNLNDYFIQHPRGMLEENFNQMIEKMVAKNCQNELEQRQEKKQQKVMVYKFVHQMKTPISVLKLICENLGENSQKIQRNLSALEYNLNQMLDLYKLDDFKKDFVSEKVCLKEVCRDSINGLKDYFIASQIYPKLEMDENIYVYSDSKWLKLVIYQLITNAIKYSDKGQTVLVRAMKKENHVFLSVIDTGLGIEKAEIKSIFDLFYIGKNGRNTADSSGIGLYIAKKVIEYLGHVIEVESIINQGTTMTIVF